MSTDAAQDEKTVRLLEVAKLDAVEVVRRATVVALELIDSARIEASKLLERAPPTRGRFIDVSRVPLICQSIVQISEDIKEIRENMINKDQFSPVQKVVYGLVAVLLLGVIGAVLAMVLR